MSLFGSTYQEYGIGQPFGPLSSNNRTWPSRDYVRRKSLRKLVNKKPDSNLFLNRSGIRRHQTITRDIPGPSTLAHNIYNAGDTYLSSGDNRTPPSACVKSCGRRPRPRPRPRRFANPAVDTDCVDFESGRAPAPFSNSYNPYGSSWNRPWGRWPSNDPVEPQSDKFPYLYRRPNNVPSQPPRRSERVAARQRSPAGPPVVSSARRSARISARRPPAALSAATALPSVYADDGEEDDDGEDDDEEDDDEEDLEEEYSEISKDDLDDIEENTLPPPPRQPLFNPSQPTSRSNGLRRSPKSSPSSRQLHLMSLPNEVLQQILNQELGLCTLRRNSAALIKTLDFDPTERYEAVMNLKVVANDVPPAQQPRDAISAADRRKYLRFRAKLNRLVFAGSHRLRALMTRAENAWLSSFPLDLPELHRFCRAPDARVRSLDIAFYARDLYVHDFAGVSNLCTALNPARHADSLQNLLDLAPMIPRTVARVRLVASYLPHGAREGYPPWREAYMQHQHVRDGFVPDDEGALAFLDEVLPFFPAATIVPVQGPGPVGLSEDDYDTWSWI